MPGARALTAVALLMLLPAVAAAQDADELARQTQNPVASLISVPLQGNWDFGVGDRDAAATLLNIQPVMPFPVSRSTNVILRVIMPLTSQPAPDGTRINGMADVVASAFFSPAKPGRMIWGAGPALLLPTATSNGLGSEKFGVGPTAVALVQPGKWTLVFLFNHVWSVSGASDRSDVSSTFLQPIINYNLGGGLAVGMTIEATANWEADEAWTAPMIFSVSKVTVLGKRPVNFLVGAGPHLAAPEEGANWRFRLLATFLYPR